MFQLTRKRAYYLLRELECVSCRTKVGTRIFVDGERMVDDTITVGDDAVVEAFCINCAHKASSYKQNARRKAHVDEAIKLMYLREEAKIPTRYDAYRNAQKVPLGVTDILEIVKRLPCDICGNVHTQRLLRWPDQTPQRCVTDGRNLNPYAVVDQFRDLVYLCDEHKRNPILLSERFDENFYRQMRALYS